MGITYKDTNMKYDYQTLLNLKKAGRYTDPKTTGLQLLVKKNWKKYWIFRFTSNGKCHEMGLGPFPGVSLQKARALANESRIKLFSGCNPLNEKKDKRQEVTDSLKNKIKFSEFAKICIMNKQAEWKNQKHTAQWSSSLERYAFPIIGEMQLSEIDTPHILEVLNPIWKSKTETASRLRGRLEWILACATAQKLRIGLNPAIWKGHLQTILPTPSKISPVINYPALSYKDIPSFFKKIREKDCMSSLALEFLILNASRTGEVIYAKRVEIRENIWTIPSERMKNKKEHKVPLSSRSLEIVQEACSRDENSEYLFSKNGRHLSNMAMLSLLKRLGYKSITVHGFRSSFRDWASEETNHASEVAEKSLAHTISNEVERAYRRGNLIEKRRMLLSDWQDYCISST